MIIERIQNYKKQLIQYQNKNRIKSFNHYCTNSNHFSDLSKHIIISGEPRGGTTWLMELLMKKSDCLIWEPLHFQNLKNYNTEFLDRIGHLPYIPENENWRPGTEYFEKLFNGRLPFGMEKNFQYQQNPLTRSKRLLIKFCRANLLLPWLQVNFPEIKPIFLIRHPLSVISSQFRHKAFEGAGIQYNLFKVRENSDPAFSKIFNIHRDKIDKINSREAMFANWWAIQHLLALNKKDSNWLTVSYEHLYLNPSTEINRIKEKLEIDVGEVDKEKITTPSSTTKLGSGILENKNQLSNFRRHLTKKQIKEILDIVHSYGIDCYTDALEPDYSKLHY